MNTLSVSPLPVSLSNLPVSGLGHGLYSTLPRHPLDVTRDKLMVFHLERVRELSCAVYNVKRLPRRVSSEKKGSARRIARCYFYRISTVPPWRALQSLPTRRHTEIRHIPDPLGTASPPSRVAPVQRCIGWYPHSPSTVLIASWQL